MHAKGGPSHIDLLTRIWRLGVYRPGLNRGSMLNNLSTVPNIGLMYIDAVETNLCIDGLAS
jgi:hypothetical protein